MEGRKDLVAETDVLVVLPNEHGSILIVLVVANQSVSRTTYLLCLLDVSLFFLPLL